MNYRNRPVRVRIGICLVGFLVAFGALVARVWQLQLLSDRRVTDLEEKQAEHQIVLSAQRGTIFDAKGRELAVSLKVPSVFADPSEAALAPSSLRKLSAALGVPVNSLRAKLANRRKHFVWLKRQVAPELGARVAGWNLRGIGVTTEWARLYPARETAAQVIGLVGTDGEGLEGIEHHYDRFLRSESLRIRTGKDRKGRAVFDGDEVLREPEKGTSLHLTLDSTIQHMAEEELFSAARESGSKSAMGVVMDPSDGRILAMVTYPPVDPNRLGRLAPERWKNLPAEEVFEPGSTFKVFTVAAALEEGTLRPRQGFNCRKGSLVVSGKTIRNTHDHDWLDPAGIIKFSNNIGAARIGLALGRDRLAGWVGRFGFGRRTGIDSPGEERGLLLRPERWRELETANVSFGQGIGVTAVQLVSAISAVANGGLSVTPRIVERGTMADGREIDFSPDFEPKRILRPETARLLNRWMERVTDPDGTGGAAAMEEYTVAGKTGTAQMIDPVTRKYSSRLVTSSFLGYAPASRPRLAAIFVFREPRRADYGGTLAAPVFRNVVSSSLAYLGVPPDKTATRMETPVLRAERKPPAPARAAALPGVPDFRGLTIREVLRKARELSMTVEIVGSGVAVRQSPERAATRMTVYFDPRPARERT